MKQAHSVNYAASHYRDSWTRHPVYGDPSFDTFRRMSGNPIHRGSEPYEWPVNGSLFIDPPSGNWYVYVGEYSRGYFNEPARCRLLRSRDNGRSWDDLGIVLQGAADTFDADDGAAGHTPEGTVVYDNGRYHLIYDWASGKLRDFGLAYAWADHPEGPWHRAQEPTQRKSTQPVLAGRYSRPYAGSLLRRESDWLVLGAMDGAPHSWAIYACTAAEPQGPCTPAVLIRNVETDYYHPPLMEFFPPFTHEGYVYAPTTSVAVNRNFQTVFRAPLEDAHRPDAWEIYQNGSVWHSEDVECEHDGIWGQTFSGAVDSSGNLYAMYPCRDAKEQGTINIASRRWDEPYRPQGFHFSAHAGASLTILRRRFDAFRLDTTLKLSGTARIIWAYNSAFAPSSPTSNSTLHALTNTRYQALEVTSTSWTIIVVDAFGVSVTSAFGVLPSSDKPRSITVDRTDSGTIRVEIDDAAVWSGQMPPCAGAIGLHLAPQSHAEVTRFVLDSAGHTGTTSLHALEALLGAGESLANWEHQTDSIFRFGMGLTSPTGARVKWNFSGHGFTLWSPRGPEWGEVEIVLDGHDIEILSLHADSLEESRPLVSHTNLSDGYHALVLRPISGAMVLDSVDIIG